MCVYVISTTTRANVGLQTWHDSALQKGSSYECTVLYCTSVRDVQHRRRLGQIHRLRVLGLLLGQSVGRFRCQDLAIHKVFVVGT